MKATIAEKTRPVEAEDAQFSSERACLQLVLLTAVGFIVRILIAQMFLGGLGRDWEGDEGDYVTLATRLVKGMGFSDDFGIPTSGRVPGLPLVLTIPISLSGLNINAIRIFMCFVESLLIPAFYLLVRSVTGSANLGLIGGIIAIFFPTWLIPAGAALSDIPAAILVALTVWMLIEGHQRQSLFWMLGAGLLWGAATLVRPVPLAYAPGIILWLILVTPGWKRRLAVVFAVVIPFVCVLAFWSIRNMQIHGAFVGITTETGSQLYIAYHPGATGVLAIDFSYFQQKLAQRYPKRRFNEVTRNALFKVDAVNFIRENPWRFAELCTIRFLQLWKVYSSRVPLGNSLAVIATFGLALPFFLVQVVRRGWQRGPEMLLLVIIISHTAVHVVFNAIVRYRLPIEPLVMAMALGGFCWLVGRVRGNLHEEPPELYLK